jgi:phosphatidylglycerophosphatase A
VRRGIVSLFAIGFGLGLSPIMPGTMGTLLAFPIAYALNHTYPYTGYILLCLLSYFAADLEGRRVNDHDHSSIVCDEVIGILPVLLWFPYLYWLAIFVLFRFFDIVKPWPISWIDRNVKGAMGCLLDDVFAGLATAIWIYIWISF